MQRLFRRLDGDALAATLSAHVATAAAPTGALQGVAVDGKAQRGRLRLTTTGCPVHALSAFCHASGLVLAHEPITADGEQAEAELSVTPDLLARVDWHDRVLTGDALFCHRALCRQVRAGGGDDLLQVKEHQPTLHAAIALFFDPPPEVKVLPLLDRRETMTADRGHGRTDERRHLVASTDLTGYLDWPGAAQVFRIERSWSEHGTAHRALHDGITSLSPDIAGPAHLLALRRGHWSIENHLHRHKDVAFGEDAAVCIAGRA